MIPDYSPISAFKSSGSPGTEDLDSTQQLVLTIAQAADDRKGGDIVLLRVAEISSLADYFVIVTGFSRAQVRAIAQSIEEAVKQQWHRSLLRKEGEAESSWIVQDYGEVIVHILMPQEREYYNLEAFWAHAEPITFSASDLSGS
ncbi:MAG TPA: ribosome silencing factor [Candidatus Caenarcaniphilales bacterium]